MHRQGGCFQMRCGKPYLLNSVSRPSSSMSAQWTRRIFAESAVLRGAAILDGLDPEGVATIDG